MENLLATTLLALGFLAPLTGATASPQFLCNGCVGAGGQPPPDSSPGCGSIGISVLVVSGECLGIIVGEYLSCAQRTKCSVTITRSWNGVTPGTDMQFCIEQYGRYRTVAAVQVPIPEAGYWPAVTASHGPSPCPVPALGPCSFSSRASARNARDAE